MCGRNPIDVGAPRTLGGGFRRRWPDREAAGDSEGQEQLRALLPTWSLVDADEDKVLVEAGGPETNKLYRTVCRWCKEIEVLIVTGAITGKVKATSVPLDSR